MDRSPSLYRIAPFRHLFTTRLGSNTANQMQAVAVGWQVYELTGSALDLGLIGLVQFLPPLCLTLLAGQFADRHDRRRILLCCYTIEVSVSLGLLLLTLLPHPPVPAIFGLLLFNGMARTFEGPSLQSLLPATVPRAVLGGAIAAFASAGKLSILAGPSIGGFIYAFAPVAVYSCCVALILCAGLSSILLPPTPAPSDRAKVTWTMVLGGLSFIWSCQAMLGAMSLDLVATLFGGATALLPIFARDILHIGPWGFGILRAAPAIGGLIVGAVLSRHPVRRAGGLMMFAGMTVYGLATIFFGLSTGALLSLVLLIVVGAGDMLSSVIRQTLIQVNTPDAVRGRVFAVNTLFNGTAGQLGMFESGVTAEWFGTVGSVVFGGAAVFAIVAAGAWIFPALRGVQRPDQPQPTWKTDAAGQVSDAG